MITISDGILTIPESERFLGFKGDNLHTQKKFFIRLNTQSGWLYRLYLTFDDGRHNFFVLPSDISDEGTWLTWDIEESHIMQSGLVKAQIKAFSDENEVYHTTSDVFMVGKACEDDEEFKNSNSEFLYFEKTLNKLYEKMQNASAKMPYVGTNGNWFTYDTDSEAYLDSGVSASASITQGSVTPEMLDREYWRIIRRTTVVGYGYFDSMIEESFAEDTIYKVAFSGLSPVKAVVGEGDFIAMVSQAYSCLLLLNITNGERWIYKKGSSVITSCESKELNIAAGTITPDMLDRKYSEAVTRVKVMASNPVITIDTLTEYRVTEYAQSLTVKLPQSITDDFECALVFRSSSIATALTCPSSVKWSGDDVASITTTENDISVTYNCLVPQVNKTYNVIFWYDGFNMNAAVRGVENE